MLCIGHYFCSAGYAVRPNTLDSYLLIYVVQGEMYTITENNEKKIIHPGQLTILNCYERPSYGCSKNNMEFFWIHFDSHDTAELYKEIKNKVVSVADRHAVKRYFEKLIDPYQMDGQPSEALVNKIITDILTEFFESGSSDIDKIPQRKFENICNYISNNSEKKISNEELAKMANMSLYHFIRAFKKETGFTPHEYLLRTRINTAMFLLRATSMSLSDITYKCGFANEAAFSNSFKSYTGMTPLSCRQEAWGKVESRTELASMNLIKETVLSQDNLEKKIVRIPEENRQEEKLKTT